jgi:uncharacterized membrane protein YiaA
MTTQAPTKPYFIASVAALIIGTGAYGIGLLNAIMELNEKGYYLITLLYGLYSVISLQKTIRDKAENIPTTKLYFMLSWSSSAIAIALLAVGLVNAEMSLSEKGFYAMAYTLSLFAAITVQKNVRDKQSISTATTVVAPTDVAPTDVAPTGVATTGVATTGVATTGVEPTDVAPTLKLKTQATELVTE